MIKIFNLGNYRNSLFKNLLNKNVIYKTGIAVAILGVGCVSYKSLTTGQKP